MVDSQELGVLTWVCPLAEAAVGYCVLPYDPTIQE